MRLASPLPLLLFSLTAALGIAGCAGDAPPDEDVEADSVAVVAPPTNTVLTAAREAGLSTFETLVLEAGLDSTLNGEGPLTVFAPTNAAFARLPEGRLDALLDDANHAELVRLLRYHVVSGRLETSSLPGPASYGSLLGPQLSIEPTADGVFVSDASGTRARVITPDLNRGNGVLHVINAVLTAPEGGDADSTATAPAANP